MRKLIWQSLPEILVPFALSVYCMNKQRKIVCCICEVYLWVDGKKQENIQYKTPKYEILHKYHSVLLKFDELAMIRDSEDEMELSFTRDQINNDLAVSIHDF